MARPQTAPTYTSIPNLVRAWLEDAPEHDSWRDISDEIIATMDDDQRYEALGLSFPAYVRTLYGGMFPWPSHNKPTPPRVTPKYPQGKNRTTVIATGSLSIRRRALTVDKGRKVFFNNCTAADFRIMADNRYKLADEVTANADSMTAMASFLEDNGLGSPAEMSDDQIVEVWGQD